jgi:transcriptional regulator with XRE-family HTH domain
VAIKPVHGAEFRYVAANVVKLRRQLGLTQEELAERVGVNTTALSRIERGTVNFTFRTFLDLAKALRVAPAGLLKPAKFAKAPAGRPKIAQRPRGIDA